MLSLAEGLSDYFEEAAANCSHPRVVASLLINDLLRHCGESPFFSPVSAVRLGELAELAGEGQVNRSVAKRLLMALIEEDFSPRARAEAEGLLQINDEAVILGWVREVMAADERSVSDYRKGKTNAVRALQGKLMAKSGGRANPTVAERLLLEELKQTEEDDHA